MITIDEEIKDLLYDAQCNRADLDIEYAERNEQRAAWLKELKAYREIGTVEGYKRAIECYTEEYTIRKSNEQYNKAVHDVAEKLIFKAVCEGCSGCCNCYEESRQNECEDYNAYMKIAEQLKVGDKE